MATVPVTRTWVAGEVVTAAHFNTNIRDVFNYLLARPILEIRQITVQSLANIAWTVYTFTSETVDSSGMHSTTVNTSRCTAVYPGWYGVSGTLSIETNATGSRVTNWWKNAAEFGKRVSMNGFTGENGNIPLTTQKIFLNVGDYLEAGMYQSSGAARNTAVTVTADQSLVAMIWESN